MNLSAEGPTYNPALRYITLRTRQFLCGHCTVSVTTQVCVTTAPAKFVDVPVTVMLNVCAAWAGAVSTVRVPQPHSATADTHHSTKAHAACARSNNYAKQQARKAVRHRHGVATNRNR